MRFKTSGKSDTKVWDAILKRVKTIKGYSVKVGIVEERQHEGTGLSLAELGAIHELGAPSIGLEARPWLSFTFNNRKRELAKQAESVFRNVVAGKTTVQRGLSQIGTFAATAVKRSISQRLIRQELAASTLARRKAKGQGEAALMATEELYDAIGFKIDKAR